MFITLWNYLRGYVIIEVSGFSVERFINLAVKKGIYIWDLNEGPNGIIMKISVEGFKQLKSCSKKTKCHIKIKERFGFPFFFFRHRKRKLYAAGVLIFVVMLYALSSFLWLIEVEGNERIKTKDIINFCEDRGFKIGAYKYGTDIDQLEKDLKSSFSEISWITIQVHGTKATIKLTETLPPIELADFSSPCNIIAKSDGVITEIITKKGTPLVKTKDVVSKGDILVSGELIVKEDETGIIKNYTHASAEIRAKLWSKINVTVPFKYTVKNYTGNTAHSYELILFDKNISLPKPEITFKNYDKFISRKQISAGENYPLPLIIITNEYREYIPIEKKYTYEEAKALAEKLINKKIIQEFDFDTDITDKSFEYKKTDAALNVTATISVTSNIGEEEPIKIQDERSTSINGTTENAD